MRAIIPLAVTRQAISAGNCAAVPSREPPICQARQTSTAGVRSDAVASDRRLELTLEDLLEEVTPPAHSPELQLGVVAGVQSQDHEVGSDLDVEALDHAAAPTIEPVGETEQRRQLTEPLPGALVEGRGPGLGCLDLTPAVVANERGQELDLAGREAPELGVIDQIGRVPVMAFARDVLADVVEQGGVLEHLAIGVVELVQGLRLIEQAERQQRDLPRVLDIGTAPPSQAGDGGAAQRARVVRPVVGIVHAHRVEHDPLAESPVAGDHRVEVERRRRSSTSKVTPADEQVGALLFDAGKPPPFGGRHAQNAVLQGAELVGLDPQAVRARRDVAVVVRGREASEVVDRPARPDRHQRPAAAHLLRRSARARRVMRSTRAVRSSLEGGSDCTSSAVSRPTPRGTLVAQRRPAESPITSSTLPPPMSTHSAGAGSSTRLARTAAKIKRASSSPLITSTSTPVSASMRSTSALPLVAVRMALVALAMTSCVPSASASWRSRRTLATARSAERSDDPSVAGHVVTQAQHVLLARDRLERAVGVHVGDEQMEGVRSEVERRDAHAAASVLIPLVRS